MFTGLVEEVATVTRIEANAQGAHIYLHARTVLTDVKLGDSIAVNGVCLTVVRFASDGFAADAVPETLRRTTLGDLAPGHAVNLERALRVGDRFGGHIVAGHVDGVGRITRITREGIASVIQVEASPSVLRYVVEKGSICLDGVSLTVMDADSTSFSVSIIPHTAQHTTLTQARVGARVNVECDVIGKYVEKLLGAAPTAARSPAGGSPALTLDYLAEHGFA